MFIGKNIKLIKGPLGFLKNTFKKINTKFMENQNEKVEGTIEVELNEEVTVVTPEAELNEEVTVVTPEAELNEEVTVVTPEAELSEEVPAEESPVKVEITAEDSATFVSKGDTVAV